MSGFTADDLEISVGSGSKYQKAGIAEKVMITEFTLNDAKTSIKFKTTNENGEEGNSKYLNLQQEVTPGKQTSAWKVTAEHLVKLIMAATGKPVEEAKAVLKVADADALVNQLSKTLIGKPFRGLFTPRESTNGKTYIELFKFEPVGGTYLTYTPTAQPAKGSELPF